MMAQNAGDIFFWFSLTENEEMFRLFFFKNHERLHKQILKKKKRERLHKHIKALSRSLCLQTN
jgi:uncharacterized protein (UPF0128 family)